MTQSYDAIVVGGGPAGSTVATRLAQRGRRVLLLEKERFPRFHIGESLLPCVLPLFEKLGVAHDIEQAGFLRKNAAEFVTADGSLTRRYRFSEGVVSDDGYAYEVDRATFDSILLKNAERHGVRVRHAQTVTRFAVDTRHGVRVRYKDEKGTEYTDSGQVLIDASGQNSFVARYFGLRVMDPELKNFAVYSHYEGAARSSGDAEGDISIVLIPEGWWWVIPLANGITSVGRVAPARSLGGRKVDEAYLDEAIQSTPYLAQRLSGAKRVAPVRTASDYSYVSRQFTGERWLLVGDAAAFIDPVFSTGVYLGMIGAFRAAEAVEAALEKNHFKRSAFSAYDRWLHRGITTYRNFVKGFYAPEFVEVMMHPSDKLQLRQAVTSLLAGHGVDSFDVTWRIWIFRAITRVNRRFALTPRLPGRREAAMDLARVSALNPPP